MAMRVSFVTTTGITAGFRHWPEAVQARALVERGHPIHAVTYYEAGSPIIGTAKESIDGVTVRRVGFDRWWRSPDLATALRVAAPRVVHLWHLRNALNLPAASWAVRHQVPLVFTVVGPFHDPYLVDDRERPYAGAVHWDRPAYTPAGLLRALLRERRPQRAWQNYRMHAPLRLADRVIALSTHEAGVLAQMGVPPERIRQIPLWVDAAYILGISAQPVPGEELDPAVPDGPLVLFIGQLKIRKGYDLLARAMPAVLAAVPAARFVFAGQNPAQAAELEAICAENGSRSALVLLGPVSEAAKVRLLRRAACLVYPTRYESFGLPPLEAMVAGCPVVSTDIPVVREMITHGADGLLAPPEDPAGLAAAIVRLLQDSALRAALVAGGLVTAATRYAEPDLVTALEEVYRELNAY
ncbi:MAG TPA: glycosyltransferase family 4 protein [Chloroflexia bacterium]|nr:glycosyltransferase family 4 protein [Chloroflexia bacterium]